MNKTINAKFLSAVIAITVISTLIFNVKAQSNDFPGYRIGRYEGGVLNTTYNVKDKVTFKIKQINRPTGEIVVSNAPSGNLTGAGTLTGNIDESGVLRISGQVSIRTMRVVGRAGGNTIKDDYRLTDSSGSIQEGNFNVSLTAAEDDFDFDSGSKTNSGSNNTRPIEPSRRTGNAAADIIGAWKGTYTCQQGSVISFYKGRN